MISVFIENDKLLSGHEHLTPAILGSGFPSLSAKDLSRLSPPDASLLTSHADAGQVAEVRRNPLIHHDYVPVGMANLKHRLSENGLNHGQPSKFVYTMLMTQPEEFRALSQ